MNCCRVYCGVFGDWGWESSNEDGHVVDESRQVFEHYADCIDDAFVHGYTVTHHPTEQELSVAPDRHRPPPNRGGPARSHHI